MKFQCKMSGRKGINGWLDLFTKSDSEAESPTVGWGSTLSTLIKAAVSGFRIPGVVLPRPAEVEISGSCLCRVTQLIEFARSDYSPQFTYLGYAFVVADY